MDVNAVRSVAAERGYGEVLFGAQDGICIFENAGVQVRVWLPSSTVAVSLSHPRQNCYVSFHFGVSVAELSKILQRPAENERFGYTVTDARAPLQLESERAALQRQLTNVERELTALEDEKSKLTARYEALPSPAPVTVGSSSGRNLISVGSAENDAAADLDELERRKRHLADEIRMLERKKTLTQQAGGGAGGATLPADTVGGVSSSTAMNRSGTSPVKRWQGGVVGGPNDVLLASDFPTSDFNDDGPAAPFLSSKSVYLNRSASSVVRDTPGRLEGNRCLYSFANEMYQDEFARAWAERPVHMVALSRGYAIVYKDGGTAWWNIPFALESKFRDEELKLPPLRLMVFGPEDNYFTKYVNGKMEWVAKDSFQVRIREGVETEGLYVNHVALGAAGSWVILWSNGLVDFDGVASDLEQVLNQVNENGPSLREISLGPAGEWFVIFTDNSVQANNLPGSLHAALRQVKSQGGRVRSIVFGDSGSWYLRYWDGKA